MFAKISACFVSPIKRRRCSTNSFERFKRGNVRAFRKAIKCFTPMVSHIMGALVAAHTLEVEDISKVLSHGDLIERIYIHWLSEELREALKAGAKAIVA